MTTQTDTTTVFDQLLLDIFTTAIEGGVQYWAEVSSYHWTKGQEGDLEGFHADLVDLEVEPSTPGEHLHVNRHIVAKGYALACGEFHDKVSWSTDSPPNQFDAEGIEDWDFDASDADVIVQLGLFGDVVYG